MNHLVQNYWWVGIILLALIFYKFVLRFFFGMVIVPEDKVGLVTKKFVLFGGLPKDIDKKEIVWRKAKLGFNAPEKTWTKEFENEMIKEIQQSEILNNFIDFKKLYFKNLDLRTKWRLYNFSAWEKEFKVKLN